MTGWTPPPLGDPREQLPDHLLALIPKRPYLSTACQAAQDFEAAATAHPEQVGELTRWRDRMRARCRVDNKFTGRLCVAAHHQETSTRIRE
ncbi:hypothetical protein JL475_31885 [Streptomyces sp. M2CJ-2]|uniref:hypothetical protein n=1 Tax=Streptomyces sp. M2CJ-2 TaxID=2803948 RepID=UPI0019253C74|nr:hypothetical protein [Streptomyces sp. M2CJ-2]MBL3670496.1 hypothetical protein [Streptomyces sp. M2CJ-2]